VLCAIACSACSGAKADWSQPNGDAHGTRAAASTSIDSDNVNELRVAWRFRIPMVPRESGVAAATPVVSDGVVYLQDLVSDVFALRLRDGRLLWRRTFDAGNPGPNGLALADDVVYGSTDTTVFALSSKTGRVRWANRILRRNESFVDIAPLVSDGIVYTATTGYGPGSRGSVVAVDAQTGKVRWRFDTIRGPLRYPHEAGGGGAWQTPTLEDGVLYVGTANPIPWGGSKTRPNGGAYPGPLLWTDSLVALDARTGAVRWFDQVTPHDVRDHDFQNPPIVAGALVIGSGKGGRVIAWDRDSHERLWETPVGVHRNDTGPLPLRGVSVCPGLLGGVETPAAYADGSVFVPFVDLCYREDAVGGAGRSFDRVDPASGRGGLVALDAKNGRVEWQRRFASPSFGCATVANDVVFTSTYDGRLFAVAAGNGRTLWHARAPAGVNACPSVTGDTLVVAAGVPARGGHGELVAYRGGS
jgi:outer membrane protein assembly factor BamB